jgi:hypothetical protein
MVNNLTVIVADLEARASLDTNKYISKSEERQKNRASFSQSNLEKLTGREREREMEGVKRGNVFGLLAMVVLGANVCRDGDDSKFFFSLFFFENIYFKN